MKKIWKSLTCCFSICQKFNFSEHGLGMYAISPSEVCLFFIKNVLKNYIMFKNFMLNVLKKNNKK